jgi:hypothetical protein
VIPECVGSEGQMLPLPRPAIYLRIFVVLFSAKSTMLHLSILNVTRPGHSNPRRAQNAAATHRGSWALGQRSTMCHAGLSTPQQAVLQIVDSTTAKETTTEKIERVLREFAAQDRAKDDPTTH